MKLTCVLSIFFSAAPLWAQSLDFLPGLPYTAANGALTVATGDFNGDGKPDLAVGNIGSDSISIYLNNGFGDFTPGTTLSLPGCPPTLVGAADVTRDGITDLLVSCTYQNMVMVIPGLGKGQFGAPIPTTLPDITYLGFPEGYWQPWTIADFNNDGIPDLAIGLIATSFDPGSSSISLLLSNGDGTFQAPVPVVSGSRTFLPILAQAADFNRDNNQDLMVVGTEIGGTSNALQQVEVFLGSGRGTFQRAPDLSLPAATHVVATAVADVNLDRIPDLILSEANAVAVYLGNGDGTFNLTFTTPTAYISELLPAHLRGIEQIDLLEATVAKGGAVTLQAAAGNGDGSFQPAVPIAFPSGLEPFYAGIVAGDWNGDGLVDLAFAGLPAGTTGKSSNSGSGGNSSLQYLSSFLEDLPAGDLVVMLNGNTPSPKLAVGTNPLQFAYVAGGAAPPAQSVAVSNSGTGILNWTATSNPSWLTVSPSSGTAPANVTVSVSPAGLTPATYTGTVQIGASGAAGSPQSITVTLTVSMAGNAPVITGVVNGASFQPGFESGSWVTIQGVNLSNTNPGRTWTASEIVNGNLPTSLDNTSVTIGGKSAYIYYISPTQLNVQAPTDATTGPVNVVVTNSGQASTAFTAQLQNYSPAFFVYGGTSDAIVSHYPDYALVGTSAAPAHPGDVLILWATGFGPTSPPTPAGIVVTGAPATETLPVITVGGAKMPVTAAVLTPGSAGLYQIAIQLPSTVPTGPVTLQASVGGATSPEGITIFVRAQ